MEDNEETEVTCPGEEDKDEQVVDHVVTYPLVVRYCGGADFPTRTYKPRNRHC